ncbi:flagellar hook capping protein [Marinobacterium sp. D7]|uniref:flagellar hook assembly protein FlgD n=1 Tax=Marinobacterium ramblicola TaxID=2849041 RepID=UPI001C2DCFBD|nr:flagellar hook capping FlgD N-terminal domain-containing protein [Marinobacterium ramblicola]MBV1787719.1 flagellar hook capping protein [Marinobacterium ramblicola]
METSGIGAGSDNNVTSRAAVSQEDFLKVLLAQLQFQDPLEPLDNNEFIAQFAQLTNLEQTQQFNEKLDTLLSLQNAGQAINLLGRSVEAAIDSGSIVGEVTSVSFSNGSPAMTIRTETDQFITGVSLGQVSVIR